MRQAVRGSVVAMGTKIWGVSLLFAIACGDDPPPSCQEAIGHFYGVGCAFINLMTNQPYTMNESLQSCKDINATVPDRCQSYFDDFMTCLNEVESSSKCADCARAQDALLGCQ